VLSKSKVDSVIRAVRKCGGGTLFQELRLMLDLVEAYIRPTRKGISQFGFLQSII